MQNCHKSSANTDTTKLPGPQISTDEKWVGPLKFLCTTMFILAEFRPKSDIGLVKKKKRKCLCGVCWCSRLALSHWDDDRVLLDWLQSRPRYKTWYHWLSGKLWYLQHNCVGDTIAYHQASDFTCDMAAITAEYRWGFEWTAWMIRQSISHLMCAMGCLVCFKQTYVLTHWGRDKMAAIFQTTFSNAFSWMKMFKFLLRFHWSLFPSVQLTIFQHWFR